MPQIEYELKLQSINGPFFSLRSSNFEYLYKWVFGDLKKKQSFFEHGCPKGHRILVGRQKKIFEGFFAKTDLPPEFCLSRDPSPSKTSEHKNE